MSTPKQNNSPILEVKDLSVDFINPAQQSISVIDNISFSLQPGEILGIVGESGCGKSVTASALIQLLPHPVLQISNGSILFQNKNMLDYSDEERYAMRGRDIGFIFQEPMSSLNPVHTIGKQIDEVFRLNTNLSTGERYQACIDVLTKVGIADPAARMSVYPHQLSGGMRQRIVIAMAIACQPKVIIADEPTTALDVTVQAQILRLLKDLQSKDSGIIFITHDLGVVAQFCDTIMVMYAGRVVEKAPTKDIFSRPMHAYTQGLLSSIPQPHMPIKSQLQTIPGNVASVADFATGCRFCQRLERTPPSNKKPLFIEKNPSHWVADCPLCVTSN